MANLLIENIDEVLLEKQRLALANLLSNFRDGAITRVEGELATQVEGLLNMLDHWSDQTFINVCVRTKEWFDKANGNSYFSAKVWVEGELVIQLPLQYGYDDHGLYMSRDALANHPDFPDKGCGRASWDYWKENKMKLDYHKETGCLKRDVKAWGEN